MDKLRPTLILLLGAALGAAAGYGLGRLQGFDALASPPSPAGWALVALGAAVGVRLAWRWRAPTR